MKKIIAGFLFCVALNLMSCQENAFLTSKFTTPVNQFQLNRLYNPRLVQDQHYLQSGYCPNIINWWVYGESLEHACRYLTYLNVSAYTTSGVFYSKDSLKSMVDWLQSSKEKQHSNVMYGQFEEKKYLTGGAIIAVDGGTPRQIGSLGVTKSSELLEYSEKPWLFNLKRGCIIFGIENSKKAIKQAKMAYKMVNEQRIAQGAE